VAACLCKSENRKLIELLINVYHIITHHMSILYRYMRRRNRVFLPENKESPFILSMIIDIAEQSHCQLPWKGTQSSFKDPFKQMIVGVKEHGYGVHLFPMINTIHKGANLTLYCIDYVIEQWKIRNKGVYPTEIYIQIDGGPENANEYVLHHCEHLVAKRMARRIFLTRLPAGHTHEDIDGCFGIIWKYYIRFSNINTFKEFQDGVTRAFLDEDGTRCMVYEWLMACPNYKLFYDPVLDTRLADLHKGTFISKKRSISKYFNLYYFIYLI